MRQLENRQQLACLCNEMELTTAVEIGTHQGVFADQFLSLWLGDKLYCIDPWEGHPPIEPVFHPGFIEQPLGREFDRKIADLVLKTKYGDRVLLLQLTSKQAASVFAKESVDFVYIDGSHEFKDIADDLKAWWPKITEGGILAGHDYDKKDPITADVVRAVDQFVHRKKMILEVTAEEQYPSWYIRKET